MKQEDIIRMALEAGFTEGDLAHFPDLIAYFAALVAAAEREECARMVDPKPRFPYVSGGREFCTQLAAAIRARGKA